MRRGNGEREKVGGMRMKKICNVKMERVGGGVGGRKGGFEWSG